MIVLGYSWYNSIIFLVHKIQTCSVYWIYYLLSAVKTHGLSFNSVNFSFSIMNVISSFFSYLTQFSLKIKDLREIDRSQERRLQWKINLILKKKILRVWNNILVPLDLSSKKIVVQWQATQPYPQNVSIYYNTNLTWTHTL